MTRGAWGCSRPVVAVDDLREVGRVGVGDEHLEEEAVELRLGQRVGALHLDRVLRREDDERVRAAGASCPATVTPPSCIASSSADWVFGVARLISSARTRCAKTGPAGSGSGGRVSGSSTTTFVPVMSAGIRSGVNWMRENVRSTACASVRTSSVLPRPGRALEQHVAAREQRAEHVVDRGFLARDDLAERSPRGGRRPRGNA